MSVAGGGFDNDRIDEKPKSPYMSLKDIRTIGIAVVLLIVVTIPVFNFWKEDANKHICSQNFNAIGKAVNLYATENNDRFPPLIDEDENGSPYIEAGHPVTWAGKIYGYFDHKKSFVCPSATDAEITMTASPDHLGQSLPLTVGMFVMRSAFPRSQINNPGQAVLIAESSNFGSNTTFDPVHYTDKQGVPIKNDGFAIGYDNSNLAPTVTSPNPDSNSVTRLAFPETNNGVFNVDGPSRHRGGIHFLFSDGSLGTLPANSAKIKRLSKTQIMGLWSDR